MPKWDNFRGKKPPKKRQWIPSTQAEVNKRVTQVAKLLIQWYQRYEIVGIVSAEYDIHPSTVDDYIKKAKARIKTKNEEIIDEELALIEKQIMDVYQWARRERKRWDATRALKLKMELKGLEAPKKHTLTDDDGEPMTINFILWWKSNK